MGRKTDNAPIGHTCPKIDSVISIVYDWYNSSDEIPGREYEKFVNFMEGIRSANSTLRDWGNEQCQLAEEFESDLDDAKDQISDLKSEIEDLKQELKSLEKELASHE